VSFPLKFWGDFYIPIPLKTWMGWIGIEVKFLLHFL
jgi:hypothetical protein